MTAYALRDGEDTILVDPLVAAETEPLLAALFTARCPERFPATSRGSTPVPLRSERAEAGPQTSGPESPAGLTRRWGVQAVCMRWRR
jgi:hypothetical protein